MVLAQTKVLQYIIWAKTSKEMIPYIPILTKSRNFVIVPMLRRP